MQFSPETYFLITKTSHVLTPNKIMQDFPEDDFRNIFEGIRLIGAESC